MREKTGMCMIQNIGSHENIGRSGKQCGWKGNINSFSLLLEFLNFLEIEITNWF